MNTDSFKHFKLHSDSTLKILTKDELISYIHMLHHNWGVCDEQLYNVMKYSNKWIPVEERLPEVNWFYTVCFDDGFITTVEFDGDWILWADATEVVAWMPLPEPYRKEDKDECY